VAKTRKSLSKSTKVRLQSSTRKSTKGRSTQVKIKINTPSAEAFYRSYAPLGTPKKDEVRVGKLRALGVSAKNNKDTYKFSAPDPKLLETFPTPAFAHGGGLGTCNNLMIEIETKEFTSLCPLTKQPDFATIKIRYRPDGRCIESKSLKLYFLGYRNHGEFHEGCVQRILGDLVRVLAPLWLEVKGEFTPRGGIPFWPTAVWENPLWNEKDQVYRTYTFEKRFRRGGKVEQRSGVRIMPLDFGGLNPVVAKIIREHEQKEKTRKPKKGEVIFRSK